MKVDARTRYTKMVIKESFVSILKQKNVDQITVTEICTAADINRTTFYKYYDNPYDLMEKLEQDILDELQQKLEKKQDISFREAFLLVLNEIAAKKDTLMPLLLQNGDVTFRNRILELCYQTHIVTIESLLPNISKEQQEWIYLFVVEGCNGMLQKWLSEGCSNPAKELVDFAGIMVDGILRNMAEQS